MANTRTSILWKVEESELKKIVQESTSIADICRKLNLSTSGLQHKNVRVTLTKRGIDFSHITLGRGSNRGREFSSQKRPLEDMLQLNSGVGSFRLKLRLIKEKVLENKCSECGLKENWNNKPISLHLEHKNGNSRDNRLFNLTILCPNCHSQTTTYAGKKRVKLGTIV